MANKDTEGNWIDPRGRTVPPSFVPQENKKKDAVVERAVRKALALQQRMIKVKAEIMADMEKYFKFLEMKYDTPATDQRGVTLTGFSGDKQVEIIVSDNIVLNEKLKLAKAIIDECLNRWSEGAHANLVVVVTQAFNVDKHGKVDTKAILKLRDYEIHDKKWNQAMDLINKSVAIVGQREYIQIRRRNSTKAKFKSINLNFSSIDLDD